MSTTKHTSISISNKPRDFSTIHAVRRGWGFSAKTVDTNERLELSSGGGVQPSELRKVTFFYASTS